MTPETIIELIQAHIKDAKVTAQGDGRHFEATVISEQFEGLNRVKKQQLVYAAFGDRFQSGEIHALNIRALTPEEWDAEQS
jgi:acid stress-induced BolA-like protein IbaG/YrbA